MTTRRKQLVMILSAQAVCLTVGLWMNHRFVTMSVRQAAREDARNDMERGARDLIAALGASDQAPSETSVPLVGISTLLLAHRPTHGSVTLVDEAWRPVLRIEPSGSANVHGGVVEAPITWSDLSEPSTGGLPGDAAPADGTLRRGFLDTSTGRWVAVAYPLRGGAGHVLLHMSSEEIEQSGTAALQSLPAIAALTLVWACVLSGVAVYMILSRHHECVERERAEAAALNLRRKQNLVRTRDAVIFGLAKLADSRDPETGQHLERISMYATVLASALRNHPMYGADVTPAFVKLIGISAALHDIGKVGVEDAILLKRGPLTKEERARVQTHTNIGGRCLQGIEQRLGSSNFLQMAREIAFAHHERWDGSGYPNGLAGEEIPLAARVVSLVDVYDALASKRVYKEAMPHEECVKEICAGAGTQFDPGLVEVFETLSPRIAMIVRRNADPLSNELHANGRELEENDWESPLVSTATADEQRRGDGGIPASLGAGLPPPGDR